MARYKPTTTPCTVQIACDGVNISEGKTMCAACRDKLAKRSKVTQEPAKLKGSVRT